MKTKLKNLFLIGIPASFGAPLFLGAAAIGVNLFSGREIHLDLIGLYMFTVWAFSVVLTEAVIAFTAVLALLLRRSEINALSWAIFYMATLFVFLLIYTCQESICSNFPILQIAVVFSNISIFLIIIMLYERPASIDA